MNHSNVNVLRCVFSLFFSFLILVGLTYISMLLKDFNFLKYIGYGCFFVTLIFIAINAIFLIKNKKERYNANFETQYNKILNYKKEIGNFDKVYHDLKKRIFRTNLYIIFILILQMITFVFVMPVGGFAVVLTIISALIVIDILSAFCNRIKTKNTISKEDITQFPYIKKIIDTCKEKLQIDEEIYIHFSLDDLFGVSKIDNKTYLSMGIGALAILSNEEVENVLYHEMAHIYNKDTLMSYKVLKSCYVFRNLNQLFVSFGLNFLLFSPALNKVQEEVELFLYFSQLEREKKADEFILQHGNKQHFINAIAKTLLCHYQGEYRFPFNVFSYEKPVENYVDLLVQERIKNYYEKKEMYDYLLKNSLQRQFDTHPSLKMRMENLQVDNFSLNFDFKRDEQFEKEISTIKNRFNKEWFNNIEKEWENYRNYHYTFYVREYDKLKDKDFHSLPLDDQLKYAYCNLVFNQSTLAKQVYDFILKDHPNNVFALLNRAYIKFGENDFSCVEDFEKVRKLDISKAEEVNYYIGMMYNNNGREDLIEQYRKNSIDDYNQLIQNEKFSNKQGKKVYEEADLSQNILNSIIEKVNQYSCIKGAYIFKKKTNEETYNYILGLDFDYKQKEEDRKQALDDMVIFTSSISEYLVELQDITYYLFMKKIIKKKNIKNIKS